MARGVGSAVRVGVGVGVARGAVVVVPRRSEQRSRDGDGEDEQQKCGETHEWNTKRGDAPVRKWAKPAYGATRIAPSPVA